MSFDSNLSAGIGVHARILGRQRQQGCDLGTVHVTQMLQLNYSGERARAEILEMYRKFEEYRRVTQGIVRVIVVVAVVIEATIIGLFDSLR